MKKGHGIEQNDTSGKMYKNSHQGSFYHNGTAYFYRDAYGSADAFFRYHMNVDKKQAELSVCTLLGKRFIFQKRRYLFIQEISIYILIMKL